MKINRGFTLIELLVVIAIIGILSSIVLVSLNSSRLKTKDSAVMTLLANIKLQAEIYYDLNNNSYKFVCDVIPTNKGLGGEFGPGLLFDTKNATGIVSLGPKTSYIIAGTWNTVTCHDSKEGWAVEAPTSKSTLSKPRMYCVDSKKMVEEYQNNLGGQDIVCGE